MQLLQNDSLLLQGLKQLPWDEEGALLLHFLLLKLLYIILALSLPQGMMCGPWTGSGLQHHLIRGSLQAQLRCPRA